MIQLSLFRFRVTNSKLKKFRITFEITNWKTEKINDDLESKSSEISLIKLYIIQFRIFEKNIGKLTFVIIDVDLALKRYHS